MSTAERNIASVRDFMERGFNRGDLSVVDQLAAADGVDHQEAPGTDYRAHLKWAITMIRMAFPDLHFEVHEILADGDFVAFRSTMTGTHQGPLNLMPGRSIQPTGRKVIVPHLYFIRMVDGQSKDLWHQWDIPGMMRQLGVMPEPQEAATGR
jgi:predicted ester cyclase